MLNPVWLYWESNKSNAEPPYITLCKWTMLQNWGDQNLIFVNPSNLDSYLPGYSKKLVGLEVDVRGRMDLIKRRFKSNTKNIAVKCDAIRANLLSKYGGVYIDMSTIALKSISPYFLEIYENDSKKFFCGQRNTHGKNHYPVSFYGCKPDSKIIKSYAKTINLLLEKKRFFHYNELGASALTPIINNYLQEAVIVPEQRFMPIPFEDAERYYTSSALKFNDLIDDDMMIFKLFSGVFKNQFNNLSIHSLYYGNNLIGAAYRYALPEDCFRYYYAGYEGMKS